MSTFAKVLYLADYIEPNRNFPQVEALRKLAYEDINQAMLLGLAITVAELKEKGSEIHEDTRQTILQLKGNEGDAGKANRSR
jgi:nicotinate-nucleotide adenylyltransferase